MKKLILLIVILISHTSCIQSFRDDDVFVILSKTEKAEQEYKYEYEIYHYIQGKYLNDKYIYKSNISYEVYDTITFGNYKYYKYEKEN